MARQTINVLTERCMFLSDIREYIIGKPTIQTICSWISFGRRNVYTGKVIKLESIRMPGGLCTSLEAYARFVEALSDTGEDDEPASSEESTEEISENVVD